MPGPVRLVAACLSKRRCAGSLDSSCSSRALDLSDVRVLWTENKPRLKVTLAEYDKAILPVRECRQLPRKEAGPIILLTLPIFFFTKKVSP